MRVALLLCSPPRLTLQVREQKQKRDLVLPATPSRTPSAGHVEAAHIWFHRGGTCKPAVHWSPGVEQPTQPEGPQGSPRRPGPQALDSFRHPNNLILQLRPIAVISHPLLPDARWCQPPRHMPQAGRAPGWPCPAPASPGTYALGSDPHLTKHNGWFANTPPSSNPPHKREHGNSKLSVTSQSRSVSGQTQAAGRSPSVVKGAVAQLLTKPGKKSQRIKKVRTSPSPAVLCFGGSRPDFQSCHGFLADKPPCSTGSVLSNPFYATKPTQPYVGSGKENKSFQDKLTLLPAAALNALLGHNSEPAKKKSDLVKKKKKKKNPLGDDGKCTEGR